jgi:copper homeostasis protein (lipoprotein)
MRILSILPISALLLFASCNGGSHKNSNKDSSREAVSGFASHQFDGLFSDTIPCADCAGIITSLNLEADSTFILEQEYVGLKEGDRVFYQLGKWSLVDSLLRLNEVTEGPRQFKIVSTEELKMLDNEGGIVTGTNLNFSLHRKKTQFVAKKPVTVRGMAINAGDNSRIKICAWGKDIPLEFTGNTIWPDAVANVKDKMSARTFAEIEGHFRTIERNGKPEQLFTAEKVLKLLPEEKCKE